MNNKKTYNTKIKTYKVLFWSLLLVNIFTCFLFIKYRSSFVAMYKKLTILYISMRQGNIYNNNSDTLKSKKIELITSKGIVRANRKNNEIVKIVFIGNSIAYSKSNKDIGWEGNWGMAAQKADNAYPQLLSSMIANKLDKDVYYYIYNLASLSQGRGYNKKIHTQLNSILPNIIVIQLGDNFTINQLPLFKENFLKFQELIPKTRCQIITTPFYPNEDKNQFFNDLSISRKLYFVDLSNILASAKNPDLYLAKSENIFLNPGIKVHPGNSGMKKIADRIFPTIQKCLEPN